MTLTQLRDYVRFLTATATTSYSDSDINFNVNRSLHFFNSEILNALDGWSESEQTNSQNLVADQQSYTFPVGLIKIKRVEVDYNGDGTFRRAATFDINENSEGTDVNQINSRFEQEEPFVDFSDKINLFPIPITSVTNGLKVFFEADPTELSADGDEPTTTEAFHPFYAYSASRDYFIKTDQDERADKLEAKMDKTVKDAKEFYGIRVDPRTVIKSGSFYADYSNR